MEFNSRSQTAITIIANSPVLKTASSDVFTDTKHADVGKQLSLKSKSSKKKQDNDNKVKMSARDQLMAYRQKHAKVLKEEKDKKEALQKKKDKERKLSLIMEQTKNSIPKRVTNITLMMQFKYSDIWKYGLFSLINRR